MYKIPKLTVELSEEGLAIQKRIEERKQPMNDISAYYEEARRQEAEARAKAEAEEMAKLPPKAMTTDEQIQNLTKAIAELTIKLADKGE